MLTKADDYPVHQTPEPIAFAGVDRNFYDRYFFNGYSPDGAVFFAAAMGFYPQLGIADAAFCLVIDGVQHNIRASRHILAGERLDLAVGPIRVTIVEALQQLRVSVSGNEAGNDGGITADLTFTARHAALEEPRFTRRNGTRLFMDYTRMTQNGGWSGSITTPAGAITIDPATTFGTRDRSWGIRPVGAPEPQPPPQGNFGQFYWLWSPCNFPQHAVFAHTNDDAAGLPWNRRAVVAPLGQPLIDIDDVTIDLRYTPGTRRIASAELTLGTRGRLCLTPGPRTFYMHGLGYTHPAWGHGLDHGPLAVAHDRIDLAGFDDNAPGNLHVQVLSTATLTWDGVEHHGQGVLEQLLVGPHAPSGFTGPLDGAK